LQIAECGMRNAVESDLSVDALNRLSVAFFGNGRAAAHARQLKEAGQKGSVGMILPTRLCPCRLTPLS
jgi:hypothetical protein